MDTPTLSGQAMFAHDIDAGLSASPKRLSSRYFYDARGDALFQQIMAMDEYYLTRAEKAIFEHHTEHLHHLCAPDGKPFRLVEFGAGDGYKTKVLLRHLVAQQVAFTYQPIDISGNVLQILEEALAEELPNCAVEPVCAEYFEALTQISAQDSTRKMVFFLGSNIGNFNHEESVRFLQQLHAHLNPGDRVLIGFDLQKDPERILAAYNDPAGITEEFNLNLLDRINRELGGNFDRSQFMRWATYTPQNGECRSFLISKRQQEVYLAGLDKTYAFGEWEAVYMELSRKFTRSQIQYLAEHSGYRLVEHLTDPQGDFVDSIWERM